mmetsp:Transcript_20629/g.44908  ORF Transcript_20629/g.44908 Transcript_20629/m.44908 type:complete len:207 (-) Transcript_20629:311-931(-)
MKSTERRRSRSVWKPSERAELLRSEVTKPNKHRLILISPIVLKTEPKPTQRPEKLQKVYCLMIASEIYFPTKILKSMKRTKTSKCEIQVGWPLLLSHGRKMMTWIVMTIAILTISVMVEMIRLTRRWTKRTLMAIAIVTTTVFEEEKFEEKIMIKSSNCNAKKKNPSRKVAQQNQRNQSCTKQMIWEILETLLFMLVWQKIVLRSR